MTVKSKAVKRPSKPVSARRRAELIDLILDGVAPASERRAECCAQIDQDIGLVTFTSEQLATTPSPAKLRRDLKQLAAALKKARALAKGMPLLRPRVFHQIDFERFVGDVDNIIANAEHSLNEIVGRRRQKQWNAVKYVAALRAAHLVRDFGETGRGSTTRTELVAAVLYEIVTDKQADLSKYKIHDDRSLDRVEPALVMRMMFGD